MKKIFVLSALCAALTASSLSAATLPIGSWQNFGFEGAPSPITDPADGFQLDLPSQGLLRIVDCCVIGDRFDIYINSVFAFTTSAVDPLDDGVDGDSEDAAWADPRMSKGSILLAAGIYQIDINVIQNAFDTSSGGASIRVDLTAVPEPASVALCGAGLLGLAFLRRRK